MIDTSDQTVAALLAACVKNPDELDCALRLADRLQEQGDEDRAEFIRVQCEFERLSKFITDSRDDAGVGWSMPVPERHRYVEVQHRLGAFREHERAWRSAGKCPECGGVGGWQKRLGNAASFWQPCHACWGGDVGGLLVMPPAVMRDEGDDLPAIRYSHTIRWRRGLIDRVEVPRLSECFEDTTVYSPATDDVQDAGWHPTPWLRAVVTHHPTVTSVVPLDREPQNHSREVDWFWVAQICDDPPSHALPKALFDAIHGGDRHSMTPGSYCAFATREDAIAALGRAVVKVARG